MRKSVRREILRRQSCKLEFERPDNDRGRGSVRSALQTTRGDSVKRSLFGKLVALLLTLLACPVLAAPSDVGVILMHGKWVMPNSMTMLARDLESRGFVVSNMEMPWSGRRLYDVDYQSALKEIEQQASKLRAGGAKRVIVAGQSMGANAAVAYASSGFELDGLVILSPGHFPEGGMGNRLRSSLDRAKSMVAANRGADSESFDDINQGKLRSIRMTAGTYVSYFDPEGLGAITRNIRKLSKAVPVFLAVGTSDPFYPNSKAMFESAPSHSVSRYVAFDSDHFSLPKLVSGELVKWLDAYPQ